MKKKSPIFISLTAALWLTACAGDAPPTSDDDLETLPVESEQRMTVSPGASEPVTMRLDGSGRAIGLTFEGPSSLTVKVRWKYAKGRTSMDETESFRGAGTMWHVFDGDGQAETVIVTNTGTQPLTLTKRGALIRSDFTNLDSRGRSAEGTLVLCDVGTQCFRKCPARVSSSCSPSSDEVTRNMSLSGPRELGHCQAKCN